MASPKRRITFLMPFIDFAFMLVIVFVALLSIAYFKPQEVSTSNLQEQLQQSQEMIAALVKENNMLRSKIPTNEQNVYENQNQFTQNERQKLLSQIAQLQAKVSELQAKNEALQKELKGKFGSSEYIDIRK
ncbi:MAG TPA: hypothetical protein ENO30_06435 [Thermodesulfobium narugense]|uniref:Uncharacterized protein n=1 Tax=Thermodesulfobium acidiphilum TaxID=1794699 RepID=A0A2R4W1B0_THEAF|nr:hypothetical protein [Thermodesulfobium acidiphilum]AWB10603.1 hypothetical protein TDSAC_1261 [Thermodesulfobium acidiphilum]PMP85417.1 MAG: hypothetical protein C0174_04530 [Thermodesulfobium narugense]HEM56377.1 hypothetical protein [Thermodesulfobium narugense]